MSLPVEIIQAILLDGDIETYAAARLACRYWDYAASSPSILWRILKQTPAELPPTTSFLTTKEWNLYFAQFSRLNLLGRRTNIQKTHFQLDLPKECNGSAVLGLSHDHRKLVALQGPRVMVYDYGRTDFRREISLALSLYPFWNSVCRALMESNGEGCISVNQRYAKYCICVSSQGNLVAVGLGKTVQIYGLPDEQNALKQPVEYKLGQCSTVLAFNPGPAYEETDGIVESLEFVDNDMLLRVAIGKETTRSRPTRVRYLGYPGHPPGRVDLAYWRANINCVYLDSVAVSVALDVGPQTCPIFRGLQLMPQSYCGIQQQRPNLCDGDGLQGPGRFFVAALQTSGTNGYCIGRVSICTASPCYEEQKVSLCRLFPSRYSCTLSKLSPAQAPIETPTVYSPPITSNNINKTREEHATYFNLCDNFHRWNPANLPSATFSSPLLAVSDDGCLLVIYEPGKGGYSSSFSEGGSLFVCSLENCTPVYQPKSPPVQRHQKVEISDDTTNLWPPPDIIPSWPFLLDTTSVDIDSISVTRCDDPKMMVTGCEPFRTKFASYKVTALGGSQVLKWVLS